MSQITENMATVSQNISYSQKQLKKHDYTDLFPSSLRTTYQLDLRKGQDKNYVIRCGALHVVAQGKTVDKAILDAIGFMESVLEESGKAKEFSIRINRKS